LAAGPAVALLAVAATSAWAATTVEFKQGGGRFGGFSGVAVEGDKGVNLIKIGFDVDANEYLIRDRASRMVGDECERLSRHALRCEAAFDGGLRVRGNDGDDVLTLRRNMRRAGSLVGGDGRDSLRGGARGDSLDGGGGGDLLSGRNGDDSIDGLGGGDVMRGGAGDDLLGALDELGRDTFLGGGGHDNISAVNRDADRRIDCGTGPDVAFVDPEDPRAKRCEEVNTIRL
jgi:hypothetical protein